MLVNIGHNTVKSKRKVTAEQAANDEKSRMMKHHLNATRLRNQHKKITMPKFNLPDVTED